VAAKKFDWGEFLEKNKWSVGIGLIGLALIITGLVNYFSVKEETRVEIIPTEEEQASLIWADIEGGVEKPGIYQLPSDSRVNDLLIKAGGLSASADRDWVKKNINLAQKLSDGIKIYIPCQGEVDQAARASDEAGSIAGSSILTKININTASASELDSLWGIGEKRAADIITNRPYGSIEELQSKKIIPANVYERIKDQITAY
jgi:competence protein ComEA